LNRCIRRTAVWSIDEIAKKARGAYATSSSMDEQCRAFCPLIIFQSNRDFFFCFWGNYRELETRCMLHCFVVKIYFNIQVLSDRNRLCKTCASTSVSELFMWFLCRSPQTILFKICKIIRIFNSFSYPALYQNKSICNIIA
jgi:hypothetical protein